MSHGGAQWCHLVNTMDNLRAAVLKQLNHKKVMHMPSGVDSSDPRPKHAYWHHLANTTECIACICSWILICKPNTPVTECRCRWVWTRETEWSMHHTSVHTGATWQIRLHMLHDARMSLWNNGNRILQGNGEERHRSSPLPKRASKTWQNIVICLVKTTQPTRELELCKQTKLSLATVWT